MILTINFKNTEHIMEVWKLAKKNKFYMKDLEEHLFNEGSDSYYPKDSKYSGWFLSEKGKKIGFIITYDNHEHHFNNILYLLIDIRYRNKGNGTKLLEEQIEYSKEELRHNFITVEAGDNHDIYKKLGFEYFHPVNNNNFIFKQLEYGKIMKNATYKRMYLILK